MIISKCDLCGTEQESSQNDLQFVIYMQRNGEYVGKVIKLDVCAACKLAIGKLDFKEVLLNATKI